MHQPITDGLEAYLAGEKTGLPETFNEHLESCPECTDELSAMSRQSRLLGVLRTNVEPRPGFYARVIERIEQQVRPSIWSLMLEPAFGRSIAVVCAVLTLVMGTYLIATEPGEHMSRPAAAIVTQDVAQQETPATAQQDRDAVLVNLASYQEN